MNDWLGVLKPLQPQLYSISSGPKESPGEVHLTVWPVRYDFQGVARRGVCSTYLADRCHGEQIAVYVRQSSNFRPPTDSGTATMIGPSTAKRYHRDVTRAAALGRNTAETPRNRRGNMRAAPFP